MTREEKYAIITTGLAECPTFCKRRVSMQLLLICFLICFVIPIWGATRCMFFASGGVFLFVFFKTYF